MLQDEFEKTYGEHIASNNGGLVRGGEEGFLGDLDFDRL